MLGLSSYWVHLLVAVVLVTVVAVLLYINSIYRRRRRRILYRLALGKTAIEGPKDEPLPEADPVPIKPTSIKRVDYDEARETLWLKMEEYMKEKEPYLNPDFDRKELAMDMYSNISYVSNAINAHGKSFTTWLAEYRVKKAINILQENPKIPTRDLCVRSGVLNPVVFNRQFRGVTGMSLSEFRSQME